MDIGPARIDRREALAAGRFGEICAIARQHGALPDPDIFASRFAASQDGSSAVQRRAESEDALALVA